MASPLTKKHNLLFKRIFDILFSAMAILLLMSWMVPLLAVIIKLSSKGPVFFIQRRNKRQDRLFNCIKFRTMIVNSEADIKAAGRDDKRITPVGKFLRAYHLDELPQLFNVLIGDMSITGPRPYMLSENRQCEKILKGYPHRYAVKPGITGLAQSLGHFGFTESIEEIRERLRLDLVYIQKWSLGMDVRIIVRTMINLLSTPGITDKEEGKTSVQTTSRPQAELVQ